MRESCALFFCIEIPSAAGMAREESNAKMAGNRKQLWSLGRMGATFCLALASSIDGYGNGMTMRTDIANAGKTNKLGTIRINNRRYLGNKYRLLSEIRKVVDEHCKDVHSFVDIFAGTGSVSSAFPDKKLITNDLLYSNYICHIAWFSGEAYSKEKVARLLSEYNAMDVTQDNYMSVNFSDTYFSTVDCRKIGYIREDIEKKFTKGEINGRERALLITSLLYAMDKIANTVGHYDAYRKGVAFEKHLELKLPVPPKCEHADNECYNEDANELTPRLEADVFFMDPPYNSRQYGDAYHLLENVARWGKPEVVGVARKMDRSSVKSDYCTRKAESAFADLVGKIKARYIVLTYNNMAEKGNDRSNAKLSDAAIMKALKSRGDVKVFSVAHKAFTTGKSDRDDNEERIFLCTCKQKLPISSPLNYTGGKYKILNQLLPLFPTNINTCIDLFCGGCNVGVNVPAKRVELRDSCGQLISLFRRMQLTPKQEFLGSVTNLIQQFGLSDSNANGYSYYGCNSSSGLGAFNKGAFGELKKHYARLPEGAAERDIALYVLIVYGFNNQIRFNSHGDFNLPVGKRDFNVKMRRKLGDFIDAIQNEKFVFLEADYRTLDVERLGVDDFVYADPPYLVTTASYNENGGWSERDERDLLNLLDRLHNRGCRFALSNVTESKGLRNEILIDWIDRHEGCYRAIPIQRNYSNANYHRKNGGVTKEVLVVNY